MNEERKAAAADIALGVVSPAERAALIERFDSPEFRAQIAEWQDKLAPLALALPQQAPSAALRANLLSALSAPDPVSAAPEAVDRRSAEILAFPSRRQSDAARPPRTAFAYGAVAAALVVATGLAIQLRNNELSPRVGAKATPVAAVGAPPLAQSASAPAAAVGNAPAAGPAASPAFAAAPAGSASSSPCDKGQTRLAGADAANGPRANGGGVTVASGQSGQGALNLGGASAPRAEGAGGVVAASAAKSGGAGPAGADECK